jgi:DNA-binding PadR family transcriptional regulator
MSDAQLMKGVSPVLVLQAVATRPRSGPEILADIAARSGDALTMPQGTLYPLLYRLERQGLLRASWRAGGAASDGEKATRRMREYALTGKGTAELARGRRNVLELSSMLQLLLGGAT